MGRLTSILHKALEHRRSGGIGSTGSGCPKYNPTTPESPTPSVPLVEVFYDLDNLSPAHLGRALRRALELGAVTRLRAFGSHGQIQAASAALLASGFAGVPTQKLASSKNSADIELVVAAMETLASGSAQALLICSSDSDFGPLARAAKRADCPCHLLCKPGSPLLGEKAFTSAVTIEAAPKKKKSPAAKKKTEAPKPPKPDSLDERMQAALEEAQRHGLLACPAATELRACRLAFSGCDGKGYRQFAKAAQALGAIVVQPDSAAIDYVVLGHGCVRAKRLVSKQWKVFALAHLVAVEKNARVNVRPCGEVPATLARRTVGILPARQEAQPARRIPSLGARRHRPLPAPSSAHRRLLATPRRRGCRGLLPAGTSRPEGRRALGAGRAIRGLLGPASEEALRTWHAR